MKIRKEFVIRDIGDSTVMVPTGKLMKEYSKMFKLNGVGKFIVELLQKEDLGKEEILQKILEEFEVEEERARTDIEKLIQKLKENDILEN